LKTAKNQQGKMILPKKSKLMTDDIEKNRKDMSLKNMQFNRFLFIRYATAFFFFVNLYWALIMRQTLIVLIPIAIMIVASLAIVEQIKLFGQHDNQLRYSKFYFRSQLLVNIVLMVSTITPEFVTLFRFVNNTSQNRLIILVTLLLGSIIVMLVNQRLNLIASNHDKYYSRLVAYQTALKNNKEMK